MKISLGVSSKMRKTLFAVKSPSSPVADADAADWSRISCSNAVANLEKARKRGLDSSSSPGGTAAAVAAAAMAECGGGGSN